VAVQVFASFKEIMKSTCAIVLLALSCVCARATVSFEISATELRTAGGASLMSLNGLVLLVADTSNDGFSGLTAGAPLTVNSFLSSDDLILFRGDLSAGGLGYFVGAASPGLGGNLGTGDAVKLYWFPTLTLSSTTAAEGTTYGSYRSATGLDGSAPWVVPNDGSSAVELKFFTTGNNQGEPFGGGPASNDPVLGWASQTVAPVPEASNLITAALALGLCALRVTRGLRQKS